MEKFFSNEATSRKMSLLPIFFLLIGIGMVTTKHGVTRKSNARRLRHTGNLSRKNVQLKDVY